MDSRARMMRKIQRLNLNLWKRSGIALALLFMSLTSSAQSSAPEENIVLTVLSRPLQTFEGFGTSENNWMNPYAKLTKSQRMLLSKLIWRDLGFKTLRLWLMIPELTPQPDQFNMKPFVSLFVESHLIEDARKAGVSTLLLAPSELPDYMKEKIGDATLIKKDEIPRYAEMLAEFIARLRDEYGIRMQVTGIQNEPQNFDPERMTIAADQLRAALDRRGLKGVRIIAPESASCDDSAYRMVDSLKGSESAWRGLSGIATHSYNMAATKMMEKRIEKSGKRYWITEAGDNGPEEPGDSLRAASMASRFLNDVNHGATDWIWFLGYECEDPRDNATRILRYRLAPFGYDLFLKYDYFKRLSQTFPPGVTFREMASSQESDMVWTYGKKAKIVGAAARNRRGGWSIGICNYTSDIFATQDAWNQSQGGYPSQTFKVTVRVKELEKVNDKRFRMHRIGGVSKAEVQSEVTMRHGELTVSIDPLELVTLTSEPK